MLCGSLPYRLGAVLAHKMNTGSEKLIAFDSCTLSTAERKYSQLEKGLAVIFTIKNFHQYFSGRPFTIYSDHQLKYLFSESRQMPVMAASRIQRWALTVGGYQYTIQHRPGPRMANAALSHLLLPDQPSDSQIPLPGDVDLLLNHLSEVIVTASQIKAWTEKDPILSKVHHLILHGWPTSNSDATLQPYFNCKDELSVVNGCVVGIVCHHTPSWLQAGVKDDTHITRMKCLAHSYVWWPGLDSGIVSKVQGCDICQSNHSSPATATTPPLGNGCPDLGQESILTTQDHFMENCF